LPIEFALALHVADVVVVEFVFHKVVKGMVLGFAVVGGGG
jgi:hypothetical protein